MPLPSHAQAGTLSSMSEQKPTAPVGDSISPERELALLDAILRHQVQLDPDHVGPVLDLAAVGIVNSAWRNSPVESWHGEGRLHDGDMLRVNAHSTSRVRQIVRRWRTDMGLAAQSYSEALDALDTDATDWLAVRIWRWLVNPGRRLPTGAKLVEVAGKDLDEYRDHADGALGGFAATAEDRGARYAFLRAAAHGGLACPHWWGTPGWPTLVGRFVRALDAPDEPHWRGETRWDMHLRAAPPQVADRAHLRRLLLREPWNLDAETAQWVVDAGIGFLRIPLPPLPEDIRESLPQ
jgi:hypothetical protein